MNQAPENLKFIDDDEADLFATFKLGEEARVFMGSNIGRYIRGVALQEERIATQGLLTVDPFDSQSIARLQMQAATCRSVIKWLVDLINEGENSGKMLANYREN